MNENMSIDEDRAATIAEFLAAPGHSTLSHREAARQLNVPESAVRRARSIIPKVERMQLPLAKLTLDPSLQIRADLDRLQIESYREKIEDGHTLPPIGVVREGDKYWVWDGFQRAPAHLDAGRETIECEVREGTYRDAFLLALGANETNGVNRSNADKRKAVETALADPELAKLSDRELGRITNTGKNGHLVGKVRAELMPSDQPREVKVKRGDQEFTRKVTPKSDTSARTYRTEVEPDDDRTEAERYADDLIDQPIFPASQPPATENTLAPRLQTTDEWLATLEIRAKLSERSRGIFDDAAKLWKLTTTHETYTGLVNAIKPKMGLNKAGHKLNQYAMRLRKVFNVRGPDHWLLCGNCGGTGFDKDSPCRSCFGDGFNIE